MRQLVRERLARLSGSQTVTNPDNPWLESAVTVLVRAGEFCKFDGVPDGGRGADETLVDVARIVTAQPGHRGCRKFLAVGLGDVEHIGQAEGGRAAGDDADVPVLVLDPGPANHRRDDRDSLLSLPNAPPHRLPGVEARDLRRLRTLKPDQEDVAPRVPMKPALHPEPSFPPLACRELPNACLQPLDEFLLVRHRFSPPCGR